MHSCEIGVRVSYVITTFSLCPTLMFYVHNEIQWPTIEDELIYVGKYLNFRDSWTHWLELLIKSTSLKMMTPIGIGIMHIRRCIAWTTWWWWIITSWGGCKNERTNALQEIIIFLVQNKGIFCRLKWITKIFHWFLEHVFHLI